MPDWAVSMGVNAIIQIVRDPNAKKGWRRALLKVFREIAVAFQNDSEFAAVAETVGKPSAK